MVAALEQLDARRNAERVDDQRDVLAHELLLQRDRAGRDHDLLPRPQRRHEIGERLPDAGARFDDRVRVLEDPALDQLRHLHLTRTRFEPGERSGDRPVRTERFVDRASGGSAACSRAVRRAARARSSRPRDRVRCDARTACPAAAAAAQPPSARAARQSTKPLERADQQPADVVGDRDVRARQKLIDDVDDDDADRLAASMLPAAVRPSRNPAVASAPNKPEDRAARADRHDVRREVCHRAARRRTSRADR